MVKTMMKKMKKTRERKDHFDGEKIYTNNEK